MLGTNNRRVMVSGEQRVPRKCFGSKISKIDNNNFYYVKEYGDLYSCRNEQHSSLVLFNENISSKKTGIGLHQQKQIGITSSSTTPLLPSTYLGG